MRLRLHSGYSRGPKQSGGPRSGLSSVCRYQRDGWPRRSRKKKEGSYEGILYLPCTAENGFVPEPPIERADVVYLCFPNNPTGAVASREQLLRWVDYAQEHEALLLFDAAYEAYISQARIPHSIFEIPGARECAIELRSFSKDGGFTGVRCGFTVMPKSGLARAENGRRLPLYS